MGSYTNACECAGIEAKTPYITTYLAEPLDYQKVRSGENKYIVREIFRKLYPNLEVPDKRPMPRPMDEWMKVWSGPLRKEFVPHCIDGLNGDQKWQVWCLERFLDMLEEGAE